MDVACPGKPCCPLYTEGIHAYKLTDTRFQYIRQSGQKGNIGIAFPSFPFGNALWGNMKEFRNILLR